MRKLTEVLHPPAFPVIKCSAITTDLPVLIVTAALVSLTEGQSR
jgi:hypothetical protein